MRRFCSNILRVRVIATVNSGLSRNSGGNGGALAASLDRQRSKDGQIRIGSVQKLGLAQICVIAAGMKRQHPCT